AGRKPAAVHRVTSAAWRAGGVLIACGLSGCAGVQSALAPAGTEASHIATLTSWLFIGGALIWAGVVGLALYASRVGRSSDSREAWTGEESDAVKRRETRQARRLIVGGGVVFPLVTLTVLLI